MIDTQKGKQGQQLYSGDLQGTLWPVPDAHGSVAGYSELLSTRKQVNQGATRQQSGI
jgi:hypothetical protein